MYLNPLAQYEEEKTLLLKSDGIEIDRKLASYYGEEYIDDQIPEFHTDFYAQHKDLPNTHWKGKTVEEKLDKKNRPTQFIRIRKILQETQEKIILEIILFT